MKNAKFFDREGTEIQVGDLVTYQYGDKVTTDIIESFEFDNTALSVFMVSTACVDALVVKKKERKSRQRTFHEIAKIVKGDNELLHTQEIAIIAGATVSYNIQQQTIKILVEDCADPVDTYKWRPFGETEWRDLATVEE
jgi:hypothetical protein